MGWRCFQFWFGVRLLLACLAHFNWFTAFFRLKCIYFSLWKSYDLLWFWMHLVLCLCFPPLRPENYLLVWCNLIRQKLNSPEKTFRQLYNSTYNRRFTKSERALRDIENEEKGEDEKESDSDNGDTGSAMYPKLKTRPKVTIKLEKDDNEDDALMENTTARTVDDDRKSATSSKMGLADKMMPSILKKKFNLGDPEKTSPDDEKGSASWSDKIGLKKLIPNQFQRSVSQDPDAIDEEQEAKRRLKEKKLEEKKRLKAIRQERKAELRRQAEIERRRKAIADSIEIMLQCLRSFASFALLVGNIRRHFAPPSPYVGIQDTAYNDPDLLMLFTITMSLDIVLFWTTMVMTYIRQCRLCCRIGICKFWLWQVLLLSLMFGLMYSPMHYIQGQLDPTWCHFMPGTDLADYLDG